MQEKVLLFVCVGGSYTGSTGGRLHVRHVPGDFGSRKGTPSTCSRSVLFATSAGGTVCVFDSLVSRLVERELGRLSLPETFPKPWREYLSLSFRRPFSGTYFS